MKLVLKKQFNVFFTISRIFNASQLKWQLLKIFLKTNKQSSLEALSFAASCR